MLLVLDVGNTSITAGIFKGKKLARQWRHETRRGQSARIFGQELEAAAGGGAQFEAAVYGSVVPAINATLESAIKSRFGCRIFSVTARSPLGIKLKVREPNQVGADLILNALAAHERARRACVVIDMGTATTFECISGSGDFLGGAIMPGPHMAAQALADKTAQLPLVEVRKPARVIGRETVECIESGLYYGYLGMIEKMLALTLKEMGGARKPAVFATGGLSRLFLKDLPRGVEWDPDLTLQGLRIAFERMKRGEPC